MGNTITKITHLSQALTLQGVHRKRGRHLSKKDLHPIKNPALVYDDKEILWVGEEKNLPVTYQSLPPSHCIDGQNAVVTPELVDCHTHLIFGGNRSHEHTMRLDGADYEEIAREGGGIMSTMRATHALSPQELFTQARERCERLYSYGVGTIEIKSGYGLSFEKEEEISRLIHRLKKSLSPKIQIHNTFMAAHAVPPGFSSSREYMNQVVLPLLEKLAKENIIDSVDIFHERGYFSSEDVELLFSKAKELSLPRRSHADEFWDNKGAVLACKHQAHSTDHLLKTGPDGIAALAASDTVATLLPGTGFFLGKPQVQARDFLDGGCAVAIGSDYNPGSCHFDNILQIASMAAPLYQMNTGEFWASLTFNAARALGLDNQGALVSGFAPRLSFFNTENFEDIGYFWGRNLSIRLNNPLLIKS